MRLQEVFIEAQNQLKTLNQIQKTTHQPTDTMPLVAFSVVERQYMVKPPEVNLRLLSFDQKWVKEQDVETCLKKFISEINRQVGLIHGATGTLED